MTKFTCPIRAQWEMICPSCLQADELDVAATVIVRLTANGTDADASMTGEGGHEWNETSALTCGDCGWTGTVKDSTDAHAANPLKDRDRKIYTMIEVDAALCAYEYMLDRMNAAPIAPFWEAFGSAGMRACSPQAGRIVDAVYRQMQDEDYEFLECFDYEFVPAVLDRIDWKALTDDNQFTGQPYKPDIEDLFDTLVEAMPHKFHKTDPKAEWMAKAKAECIKQWQYADLVTDHQDRTDAACQEGQDPAEFVRWLGEKYGLTPVSVWNS